MARAKKTQTKADNALKVLQSTADEPVKKARGTSGGDMVYIACGMPLGIKFDDVDNGNGGYKTIEFPGINHALRGKSKAGVLLGSGNAVCVAISRQDWECIKRKHGRERAFTALPPLLIEMKSESEFRARRDEIAEMKTGVDPINPKQMEKMGIEKVNQLDDQDE